jgi:hypothetical protein
MSLNFETAIHTRLSADATLMATLTGGIYRHNLMSLSKTSFAQITASMRDPTTGKFKPWASVYGRGLIVTPDLKDEVTQFTSTEQTVEVWILDDPTSSPVASETAAARIYTLLNFKPPTGAYQIELVYHENMRDPDFANARLTVMEWLITAKLGG